MNALQQQTIDQCTALSVAGDITFADVVSRLLAIGVERYHADYSRKESTFYLPTGASHVVAMHLEIPAIASVFSATAVEQSVRQAQLGEIRYPQFVAQTAAAGCVGYFVQLSGQRVHYIGRDGDVHTEWFPGAK